MSNSMSVFSNKCMEYLGGNASSFNADYTDHSVSIAIWLK